MHIQIYVPVVHSNICTCIVLDAPHVYRPNSNAYRFHADLLAPVSNMHGTCVTQQYAASSTIRVSYLRPRAQSTHIAAVHPYTAHIHGSGEYFYDYILNIEGTDVYLVFVSTTIQHV